MSSSSTTSNKIPSEETGRELALHGINLLLNNNSRAAEEIFTKYKDDCIQMRMGYCFLTFMNALMTFEEEKINLAHKVLKDTESKFAHEVSAFQSMKRMVFGQNDPVDHNIEKRLEEQIGIADCQVCMAILVFTHQDFTSYIKGGWILRKAWKVYDRTYREIKELHDRQFSSRSKAGVAPEFATSSSSADDLTDPDNWLSSTEEVVPDEAASRRKNSPCSPSAGPSVAITLKPEVTARLLASVSFGYGTFQLCISLLPPNLLKVIHFLGFESDKDLAVDALMHARKGNDIRAPFATLGLLWYHTIVRPFFSLDGNNIVAGVEAAEFLLNENEVEYGKGAIFLFYHGRVERLKGQLEKANSAYQQALCASSQREIQLICVHEMGWCYILQFNWKEAHNSFLRLKSESRWAKSYYAYLVGVALGVLNQFPESLAALAEVPTLIRRKNNQLEAFVLKRSVRLVKRRAERQEMLLYGMELLYLWHAIPSCSSQVKEIMLNECNQIGDKKLLPLKCLVEGSVHHHIGNRDLSIQCLEECLARSGDMKDDVHIFAFATYELSIILLQRKETFTRGKALLIRAKDEFKGYDFENRLHVRIHAALKSIENQSSRSSVRSVDSLKTT